jgi:hypothetical protein
VELDFSANNQTPHNLLLDASASSTVNELHGLTSFSLNNTTGSSSHDSPSIVSSTSEHQQTTTITTTTAAAGGKKESHHLLSWFHTSSTSTSASSAVHNVSVTSSSSSAITASPPTVAHRSSMSDVPPTTTNYATNGQDDSPSTKISSKLSYGEMFISKFNKHGGNKASSLEQQQHNAVEHATGSNDHQASPLPSQQQPQQKSSRRTTSLLNLFMSNSQGNKIITIFEVTN